LLTLSKKKNFDENYHRRKTKTKERRRGKKRESNNKKKRDSGLRKGGKGLKKFHQANNDQTSNWGGTGRR